jgi:anti-sigma-K factor RskA
MTEGTDIDALAAEYVLGTLDAAERADVVRRRRTETDLDMAITAWEVHLAPLDVLMPEIAPPPALKAAVMARIAGPVDVAADLPTLPPAAPAPGERLTVVRDTARIVQLERRVARWRAMAAGVSALAASLAGVILVRETTTRPPVVVPAPQPVARGPAKAEPQTFVAVLQKDAASPAFLMTVDIAKRTFTVRPVAATRPEGKSYELWIVHERLGTPRSLGLLATGTARAGVSLATFETRDIAEATYAITLEPEGGSPVAGPTGPVVYAGKLLPADP